MANPPPTAVLKAIVAARSTGTLNLNGRGLQQVPSAVYNLEEAVAGHDAKWWEVAEMYKMDLSRNALTRLPPELGLLSTLTHLDVSSQPVRFHVPSPPRPQDVNEFVLPLRRNQLSFVPPELGLLPALRTLELRDNLLTAIPAEALDLSQTGLSYFPPEVPSLPRLRVLNLSSNRLEGLPAEVATMTRLEELNLCNNNIAALPPQLGLLSASLRSLGLEGNPLRTLRRPILERGTAAVLQYLKDRIPQ
ncbi:Leucine-rich repeat-containing protein 40 [Tetrabaena socialis]|uniref:Leucine-rich repeat-containing protein 40 n=1 Tax=Tetrabaena socialis TaxID=47790 RepID=A0A2J7ZWV7_9CHLO|nr:Leucine-rich repeat-containing protein 40 [Tetrabaena socialis]|eukprot:PNH04761.1 Leucine-rich repeat-containing protein 40 [Tetrabaena socialis]